MKKIILISTLLLNTYLGYSQAWQKGGNLGSANPPLLGTNSNEPLRIITNGVQRMHITETTGNVGIGNTAPANKLVVNGGTSLGFNLPAPANGLAVRGRAKFGTTTNTANPLGHVHINGNTTAYQLVIEASPFGQNNTIDNPDVTFITRNLTADRTGYAAPNSLGLKAQMRYFTQLDRRGLGFDVNDFVNSTSNGLTNTRMYISGVTGAVSIGNNNFNPANRLEITSQTGDPTLSGLRFTNLTNLTPVITNTTNKVLSINEFGDVILVNDEVGTGGGGTGITQAQNGLSIRPNTTNIAELGRAIGNTNVIGGLTSSREVMMNGNNIWFSGTGNGKLYVGDYKPLSLSGKINIDDNVNSGTYLGIRNTNLGNNVSSGIFISAKEDNTGFVNIAKYSENHTTKANLFEVFNQIGDISIYSNYGYHTRITGGGAIGKLLLGGVRTNPGANHLSGAFGSSSSQYTTIINDGLGLTGQSFSSMPLFSIRDAVSEINGITTYQDIVHLGDIGSNNPGLMLTSTNYQSGVAVLIRREGVSYLNGNGVYFGIGTSNPQATLHVNGSCFLSTGFTLSDSTLKKNHTLINTEDAVSKLMKLTPKSYEWINPLDTFMFGEKIGFIAQEVSRIIPNAIQKDSFGVMHIDYNSIIAISVKAIQANNIKIQEQDSVINQLNNRVTQRDSMFLAMFTRLEELEAQVNNCCSAPSLTRTQKPIETEQITVKEIKLSNNSIVLNQNVPNPFKEKTTIAYNIPVGSGYAQLIFNDNAGRIIKTVDLEEKGKGELVVYAEDLSNGTYTYSLVIDGKTIDTKKMLKQD